MPAGEPPLPAATAPPRPPCRAADWVTGEAFSGFIIVTVDSEKHVADYYSMQNGNTVPLRVTTYKGKAPMWEYAPAGVSLVKLANKVEMTTQVGVWGGVEGGGGGRVCVGRAGGAADGWMDGGGYTGYSSWRLLVYFNFLCVSPPLTVPLSPPRSTFAGQRRRRGRRDRRLPSQGGALGAPAHHPRYHPLYPICARLCSY